MGFTAVDGPVMGTRCGALDPGLVRHFQTQMGMSAAEVSTMLNRQSGLPGISGISTDMRTLLASDAPQARDWGASFVYRIVREAGALAAAMWARRGRLYRRQRGTWGAIVADRLGWRGALRDPGANAASAPVISAPESRLALRVIPTGEEAMIVDHTPACLAECA